MERDYGGTHIQVAINIPSGKLAFGNDFREQFDPLDTFNYDVNADVGIKNTIEDYSKLNLAHGFVGNTCPRVYRNGDIIHILDSSVEDAASVPGEKVGSICTDLWWYSMADYEEYVAKGGDPDVDYIEVTPGRYVLSHAFPRPINNTYATLTRSNEPIRTFLMPEERAAKEILPLMPDADSDHKNYIDIFPHYVRNRKWELSMPWSQRLLFKGYVVRGHYGPMTNVVDSTFTRKCPTYFKYLASPDELKNPEKLWESVLSNEERKKLLKIAADTITREVQLEIETYLSPEFISKTDDIKCWVRKAVENGLDRERAFYLFKEFHYSIDVAIRTSKFELINERAVKHFLNEKEN